MMQGSISQTGVVKYDLQLAGIKYHSVRIVIIVSFVVYVSVGA